MPLDPPQPTGFFMNVSNASSKNIDSFEKLIPWESSCFSISPEFFVVWLIYLDEELLAAKRNRLAVNRTFSGRRFAGCLPFFRVRQGGVLEKQEASVEEAGITPLEKIIPLSKLKTLMRLLHRGVGPVANLL